MRRSHQKDFRTLSFLCYELLSISAVWAVLVPFKALPCLWHHEKRAELRERLAHNLPSGKKEKLRILFHAVSAGEMRAAGAVAAALVNLLPDLEIFLSTGNREGQQVGELIQQERQDVKGVFYLPWDQLRALRRWLQSWKFDLVAVIETELWPNLFRACHELSTRLCIVNGRIYPRDVFRYRLARNLFSQVLECADWIGVQNQEEARRFEAIGADPAKITVSGNVKFDSAAILQELPPPPWLPSAFPILIGASTHAPEEAWLLELFDRLRCLHPKTRMVLAPRHVRRSTHVLRQARTRGRKAVLWSHRDSLTNDWEILILDKMGVLPQVYSPASIAIMGGTFSPHGGHNFLEAAARSSSIVVGPHVDSFREVVEQFEAAGALLRVENRDQLFETVKKLLDNPAEQKALGNWARIEWENGCGSAAHYASVLRDLLLVSRDMNKRTFASGACKARSRSEEDPM
ncbi:MAG: hypothetical protein HY645_12215 [Acidobacteria bacterium]|nr:hypothetical protein [Acidobacteriota bacterium]